METWNKRGANLRVHFTAATYRYTSVPVPFLLVVVLGALCDVLIAGYKLITRWGKAQGLTICSLIHSLVRCSDNKQHQQQQTSACVLCV